MAVAFTSSSGILTLPLGTSKTFAYDVGAASNRAIAVASTQTAGGMSITAVSYAATSLGSALASAPAHTKVWGDKTTASGSNNVVATYSAYGSGRGIEAVGWSGVDQTTPFGTGFTNTGTSSSPTSGSQTCPSNGALYASMWGGYEANTNAPASGTGTTLTAAQGNAGSNEKVAGGYRLDTGAVSWTTTSSAAWEVAGVPINAAGGGAASVARRLLLLGVGS